MMLLGVVLHIAALYIDFPIGRVPDAQTSTAFDFGALLLHLFRMPVFFMMSGFFTALLLERRGPRRFIANRTQRIVVPLVVSWFPLFVLTWMSAAFALRQSRARLVSPDQAFNLALFVRDHGLVHLWFLYYLIYLYGFALGAAAIWRRLPPSVVSRAGTYFARFAPSPFGVALLSLLTVPALFNMKWGLVAMTAHSFIPSLSVLYVFGLFFFFGVALYSQRDLLPLFRQGAWMRVAAGLAIVPLNLAAVYLQSNLVSGIDHRLAAHAGLAGTVS
jgi:fucose 4-O-acetylase-like acetyltransferase